MEIPDKIWDRIADLYLFRRFIGQGYNNFLGTVGISGPLIFVRINLSVAKLLSDQERTIVPVAQ